MTHRSSCTRLCHTDLHLQCTEFHHRDTLWPIKTVILVSTTRIWTYNIHTKFHHSDTLWSVKTVVLVSATRIYTYNVQNFTIGIHCDPSKQLYSSLPHGFGPTMYRISPMGYIVIRQSSCTRLCHTAWHLQCTQNFTIGIHCDPSKQLYSSLPHGLAPTMYTELHHRDTLWSVKAVVLVSATRLGTYNVHRTSP